LPATLVINFRVSLFVDEVMSELVSESGRTIMSLWSSMEKERLDHSLLHLIVSTVLKYMATNKKTPTDELERTHQVHALH